MGAVHGRLGGGGGREGLGSNAGRKGRISERQPRARRSPNPSSGPFSFLPPARLHRAGTCKRRGCRAQFSGSRFSVLSPVRWNVFPPVALYDPPIPESPLRGRQGAFWQQSAKLAPSLPSPSPVRSAQQVKPRSFASPASAALCACARLPRERWLRHPLPPSLPPAWCPRPECGGGGEVRMTLLQQPRRLEAAVGAGLVCINLPLHWGLWANTVICEPKGRAGGARTRRDCRANANAGGPQRKFCPRRTERARERRRCERDTG